MKDNPKDLSKISNNEILSFEEGVIKAGLATPHQVLTDNVKLKYGLSRLEEYEGKIRLLNDRITQLEQQVIESGCIIKDSMSLNFTIENIRAKDIENNVTKIISLLRLNGVSADLVQSVEKLLTKGDV